MHVGQRSYIYFFLKFTKIKLKKWLKALPSTTNFLDICESIDSVLISPFFFIILELVAFNFRAKSYSLRLAHWKSPLVLPLQCACSWLLTALFLFSLQEREREVIDVFSLDTFCFIWSCKMFWSFCRESLVQIQPECQFICRKGCERIWEWETGERENGWSVDFLWKKLV